MNIKVKLGIFIMLYLLVLAVISFSWIKTIRMQSAVKPENFRSGFLNLRLRIC